MTAADEMPGDWFPGGYPRDRAAAVSIAIELGLHDDGQGDAPEIARAARSGVEWSLTAAVQAHQVRSGYRFGATVHQVAAEWIVIGIATLEPESSHGEERVSEILGHHAHQFVGTFADYGEALQHAERFVLRAPMPGSECSCEELVAARTAEAEA